MVIIIGAGIAGLTCAKYLQERGIQTLIIEKSNAVGGRIRTDLQDGFLLDRGFQILLTAYPEAQKCLDYKSLNLKSFQSGAMIYRGSQDEFITLANPFKEPSALFSTLLAPIGSIADKLRILRLVMDISNTKEDIFQQKGVTTIDFLRAYGFSEKIITQFFKPFFGGVFLENELLTSATFFKFIFDKFYQGDAVIPAQGMQQIPLQIASQLAPNTIQLNTEVLKIDGNQVVLANGQSLTADKIVLATDGFEADKLLGLTPNRPYNMTTCTYFSADRSPLTKKMLVLNPNRASSVHNICVPSDIAPQYAPVGKSLISVSTQGLTTIDEKIVTENIKQELIQWFGKEVVTWQHLKTYKIPRALATFNGSTSRFLPLKLSETLYQCGDCTAYPSLNAAMMSGRKVAELC